MKPAEAHTRPGKELDSFPDFYRENVDLIRGILFQMRVGHHLDDLVQDTFVKAWKGLNTFRGDASPKTWLRKIAMNTALDHFRKAGSALGRDTMFAHKGEETDLSDQVSAKDLLSKGLNKLSPEHRACLVLWAFHGLSLQETADILALPLGTVKSRLHHARKQIRTYFQKEGIDV